ncbi:Quinone oxidoreductase [Talaromyces pinophilus]|nr:Quinone oxidoreductase [Talaromyces pinophilus]
MRVIDIKGDVDPAESLHFTEVKRPVPGPEQALVRVKAFGINRLEFSGMVEELQDDSNRVKVGDEVYGLTYGGAYAEYVVVSIHMLIQKPSQLSWEECTGIPETWLTTLKVMYEIGEFARGRSILWHAGGSGVSVSGIQLSIAGGASAVYATARSDNKLDFCTKTLDCTAAFNTNSPNWDQEVMKATNGKGVDIVVDLVGPAVFSGNLRIAARDARIVLVGLMSGFKLKDEADLGLLAFKRVRYEGSTLRSRDLQFQRKLRDYFVEHALPEFQDGKFRVYIHRVFPWEQVVEAHKLLESNAVAGKIIVTIS